MANIKVDLNNKKIILDEELRSRIEYMYKCYSVINENEFEKIKSNEMKLSDFNSMMHGFIEYIKIIYGIISKSGNENIKSSILDEELRLNIVKECEECLSIFPNNEYSFRIFNKDGNVDIDGLETLINLLYKIHSDEKKIYLIRDLKLAKDDCIIDLKYFLDDKSIESFNNEYTKASEQKNIERMKELLETAQSLILKEWEKYGSINDDMNDDNFRFIGHSTSFTDYDSKFRSRYVSCSLFDQDINDTFHSGFGFIMAPKNIIGADKEDMQVYNDAIDEEHTLYYSSVKRIHHPKRILEECKKEKEENLKNKVDRKVYSEVFIDGFTPVGIFCFTNGTKGLNGNYQNALKLQEHFPDLKIRTFDTMKHKKGTDLDKAKIKLISSLYYEKTKNMTELDSKSLPLYSIFLEKFEELKNKDNYTEEDIMNLFNQNIELISLSYKSPDDLFSGRYNDEEIEFILDKNINYGIYFMLNGDISLSRIEDLKKLVKYKDKVGKYYDGISEFLDLISKVDVTNEMIEKFKKEKPLTFDKMNKQLLSVLSIQLNEQKNNALDTLSNLKNKYQSLYTEYETREELERQNEFYYKIELNKYWYKHLKLELEEIKEAISNCDKDEEKKLKRKEEIEQELEKLTLNQNITTRYEETEDYLTIQNRMNALRVEQISLKKHPLKNRKAIKNIGSEIQSLNIKSSQNKSQFGDNRRYNDLSREVKESTLKSELRLIDDDLKLIISIREKNKHELDIVNKKIFDFFGCHSLEEAYKLIEEAKEFSENYSYDNKFYLDEIKKQLEDLQKQISAQENNIQKLDEIVPIIK